MKEISKLDKLRTAFKNMFFAASTPLTTTDGKNLLVMGDDAAEGLQVFLVDDNNNQTPLEDGDYILQDGRTITVAGGIITAIALPTAEDANVDATKQKLGDGVPDGQLNSEGKDPTDVKADGDVESRLSALENQVAEILTLLQNSVAPVMQSMSNQNIELAKKVKEYGGERGGEKVKVNRKMLTSDTEVEMSLDGALDRLKNLQSRGTNKATDEKVNPKLKGALDKMVEFSTHKKDEPKSIGGIGGALEALKKLQSRK